MSEWRANISRDLFLRLIGGIIFLFLGWQLGQSLGFTEFWIWVMLVAGALIGLVFMPYLTVRPLGWALKRLRGVPGHVLLAATVGIFLGLIVSALLAFPLAALPDPFGSVLPLAMAALLSYLGAFAMVSLAEEFAQVFSSLAPASTVKGDEERDGRVLLDTSAIIDGRIADISQTGFIQGTLLIPRFVLDELRHIADSSDSMRRNRGRRGLEMLSKLQKKADIPVQIVDLDAQDVQEVDAKLVSLARSLHCSIVTNDFNLNRVAELQGVRVLNVNELANAVKSLFLPGEEIKVRIIQEGKEQGQGVAFLDDGTMVVVEGGRRHINSPIDVVITRVLQTAAGRMIFAHPKAE